MQEVISVDYPTPATTLTNSRMTTDHPDPEDTAEAPRSRRTLVAKVVGLLVALLAVGIALLVVLWLLAALTVSLLGNL